MVLSKNIIDHSRIIELIVCSGIKDLDVGLIGN